MYCKDGKISEGVFNLAPILKNNEPNQNLKIESETCSASDSVWVF